jgi:UDP-N-acetylglucosamine transferase subunit ALG13
VIFASVGSMFAFDRLVRTVDEWARAAGANDVLLQIGDGTYIPHSAEWVRSLSPSDFSVTLQKCDLFVAHLGMGSLIAGVQARKPIVLLPRIKALGEHTTDHQVHGAQWVRDKPGVWVADDERVLLHLLNEFAAGRIHGRPEDIPPYASPELITAVRRFIDAG